MKRKVILLLAILAVISLTACTGNSITRVDGAKKEAGGLIADTVEKNWLDNLADKEKPQLSTEEPKTEPSIPENGAPESTGADKSEPKKEPERQKTPWRITFQITSLT